MRPRARSGMNSAERNSSARRSSKSWSLEAIILSCSSVTLGRSWLTELTIARGNPTGASGSGRRRSSAALELLAPPRRIHPRSNPPQLPVGGDAVERRDVGERRHDERQQPRHGVLEQQRAVRDFARSGE